MPRVEVGGKKPTAAEKRAQDAREAARAAAAESGPARRGEEDDGQEPPRNDAPAPAVPGQATAEALAAPAAPALPAVPVPALPAPMALALPDRDAAPADQLAVCERAIHGAKARWTAKVEGANEAFINEAGPYLAWVHEHKLYKLEKGNDGKPYRSFEKYLKEQHNLTRRTGYRITQTMPLLRILEDGGHPLPDLSSRQVDALHPVRTQHGDDAVLRVWTTAWETKKNPLPTPEELGKAKQLLDLVTKPDVDEELPRLPAVVDPGAAVVKATKLLVPDTLREAVKKDPERIRILHRLLSAALTEAGEPVD